MKGIATIITYNPEIELLRENIEAIISQVSSLLIVDNASNNIKDIIEIIEKYDYCNLIKNETNNGIAKAFNQAVEYALENKYEWLLTLDQDTTVPSNIVGSFNEFIHKDEKVAVICPYLIDINLNSIDDYKKLKLEPCQTIDRCISSGSYINLEICNKIGKFDEKMFIDWVDFEYCERIRRNGFKILRVNEVYILHQVGMAKKVKLFNREEIVYNHNPIRKYYYYRNRIYFARKYKLRILRDYKYYRNLFKNFILILKEENAMIKVKSAIKGCKDGFFMNL